MDIVENTGMENWMVRARPAAAEVVIVGGGAAGLLSAIALLRSRHSGLVLVERDCSWSTGPAYATQDPRHLLNVPAGKLSADGANPYDFVEWASERLDGVTPGSFLPRRLFGEYLREALDSAARASGSGALTRINAEVVSLDRSCTKRRDRTAVRVVFRDGRSIDAAHVVLALGNPSARALACASGTVINDPWSACQSDRIGPDDPVMIVGSGLTGVDVALSLIGRGHRGPIRMLSRHGLLPRAHATVPTVPLVPTELRFEPTARSAITWIRAAIARAGGDWRAVFDALRPHTNEIWERLPEPERARLVRHANRYWEVHRHRLAPEVAAALEELLASGRLAVGRGAVGAQTTVDAKWVVNCTGPNFDLRASSCPLVASLLANGEARPGPLGLGFDVTRDGALVDDSGRASSLISVVGPLRRGTEWETTAIPDIRGHAEQLARRVPAARRRRLHATAGARARRQDRLHTRPRLERMEAL